LAAIWLVAVGQRDDQGTIVYRERNFFGTLRVSRGQKGHTYYLYHGNVRHGAQNHSDDARVRRLPLLYFYPTGPAGQVFRAFRDDPSKRSIAIIGLGVGALAGYGESGQDFTFFEIDPAVENIAYESAFFTYLADATARNVRCRVVLGDARISLQRPQTERYGLLVVDAFSGDAIPIHLLTVEAVRLYLSRLNNDGVLLFHITNDYLELEPVLGNVAHALGLAAYAQSDRDVSAEEERRGKAPSHWVLIAQQHEHVFRVTRNSRWRPAAMSPKVRVWTDDYSNLLSAFRW
jgi:hypothetical protein